MPSRLITDLDYKEARNFFMKQSSYINFELPPYINFESLLTVCSSYIGRKQLNDICKRNGRTILKPKNYQDVNYTVLSNKDGAFSWRPIEIIHPMLYVDLVNTLTKNDVWETLRQRFSRYRESCVECISVPRQSTDNESDKASSITNWWESMEQETIKQAIDYKYIAKTDITDCYGSIYTHVFEWALDEGGKLGAKERKKTGARLNPRGLGSIIDEKLMNLNSAQTNGIPQGSVIMDFLAEVILGYADELLTERIESLGIESRSFKILRYRDDYSILTQDRITASQILKALDSVLYEVNFKMSPLKTLLSEQIIDSAVKPEKLELIYSSPSYQSWQKRAMRIYLLSSRHPNSGVVAREISEYYDDFVKYRKNSLNHQVLISIFSMVGITSPKYIYLVSSVISLVMKHMNDIELAREMMGSIINKYKSIPNSGFIDIWLQRISEPMGLSTDYVEPFTNVALKQSRTSALWNSEWANDDMITFIDSVDISNLPERISNETISYVIERPEFELYRVVEY